VKGGLPLTVHLVRKYYSALVIYLNSPLAYADVSFRFLNIIRPLVLIGVFDEPTSLAAV